MPLSESVFLILLDLNAIDDLTTYKTIAELIGVEFFADAEQSLYTLGTDTFVLDITENSCSLLFVDEKLTERLGHIQKYFNTYLRNKKTFYYLLRFFVKFTSQAPRHINLEELHRKDDGKNLVKYKNICECIFSDTYCIQRSLEQIEADYNIFTHRCEYTHFSPLLSLKRGEEDEEHTSFTEGVLMKNNLFYHFYPSEVSLVLLRSLPSSDYFFDDGEIKMVDESVYVEERRCGISSFLYKSGLSLADAVEYARKIQKIGL